MQTLRIVPAGYSIALRLPLGFRLRVFESEDGRSRAYWCRADGYVVRWVCPPLC